nr:transmembrane protein 271 [Chrysemys picta bellii]
MKWSVRGACAALSSCLLLACALSAAAVGLKCFSLGSELKGEPFRLGTAAGAFYSGLLLAAGLSLLGSALLCCRPPEGEAAAAAAGGQQPAAGGGEAPGGRRAPRPSQGSIFSSEEPELSPADCPFQAVSYINVGVFHVFDEAGVEVHCGGHPSLELPGYSPMDPELNPSYPYCYPLPHEQPPAYEEIYPGEPSANSS